MNDIEKRQYMIKLYATLKYKQLNKETLDEIGKIVRTKIVRKIKFVPDEHTSGLTKSAIENSRKFPSFWQPDLTVTNSLQNDCFQNFPSISNGTLKKKVLVWIAMREKVIESIRSHRNSTQTALQRNIVEGETFYMKFHLHCIFVTNISLLILIYE